MPPSTDPGSLPPALRQTLDHLPREPGVYLMRDREGQVLYVGKAKSLRARVRSYFTRSGDSRAFVPLLGERVSEVETIVTTNEKEALLLENTLIKRHRPRFNVLLRDDKSHLVLRLDPRVPYPRLEVTRRIRDDGARYFGPYHAAADCRQTLRLVNRHFGLRTCSDRAMRGRSRPCLQHEIKRCLGPCVLEVDAALYAQQVEDVTLFLRGRGEQLLDDLQQRMTRAAAALEFESAARLRDQMAAVRSSLQGQEVVSSGLEDRDVFGFDREGEVVEAVVLVVRRGRVVGRRSFSLSVTALPDGEVLGALVSQFYDRGEAVPPEVLVPLPLEDTEAKRAWLADLRGGTVALLVPRRGGRRRLLELAGRNARANLLTRRQRGVDAAAALARLQRRLRLSRLPQRIECFDISSVQGQQVVASLVVLEGGEPRPARYRRFRITSAARDDFAAMYEVIARRLRRAREGQAGWELPDLLVVDGGKGQLAMALAALRDAGLPAGMVAPEVVALAKERSEAGEQQEPDRVFLPHHKDPLRLRPHTSELLLLARIRDEAHRFAVAYHRTLRRRRSLRSGLEDIPGIGPRRRRELLRALGTLKHIRAATVAELAAVPGMTSRAAEAVHAYFTGAAVRGSEGARTQAELRGSEGARTHERVEEGNRGGEGNRGEEA